MELKERAEYEESLDCAEGAGPSAGDTLTEVDGRHAEAAEAGVR